MQMKLTDYKFTEEEINKIPAIFRYVLNARLTGECYNDLAYNFGLPLGTVKSRLSRATKILLENRQNANTNIDTQGVE